MRKEVRSVGVGTATHIVDCVSGQTGISELQQDQRSEVSVRPGAASIDLGSPAGCLFHFARDLFTDFECAYTDVRTDRGHEIPRLV